jgi:hypothetical protein
MDKEFNVVSCTTQMQKHTVFHLQTESKIYFSVGKVDGRQKSAHHQELCSDIRVSSV